MRQLRAAHLRILMVILLVPICLAACSSAAESGGWLDVRGDEASVLPIVLYYEDVCSPCDTEGSFRDRLSYETRGLESGQYMYEAFDTFRAPQSWKQDVQNDWDLDEIPIPSVRVGDTWLLGETEVQEQLRLAIYKELGIETANFSYYMHADCPDCHAIEEDYNRWLDRHPEYFVTEHDAKDDGNFDRVRAVLEELEVPSDLWEVPFFVNDDTGEYWTISNTDELLSQ